MPEPNTPVHWVDQSGNQYGPEPFDTVTQRVRHGQIPSNTNLWWDGAPGWTPFDQVPGVDLTGIDAAAPTIVAEPVSEAAPVEAAPVETAPVETAPVETAPVETAPVETAPVETAPVEPTPEAFAPAPVEAAPVAAAVIDDAGPMTASQSLMSGLTDQQLDDEFIGLVGRSWEMYKETEFATSIDEAMLGGIITALVDCGFVLIDLETAGALYGAATADPAAGVDVGSSATSSHHQLRFEEPETKARVTVALDHLTPDVASAKMIGHRASAIIGYGERVKEFQKVGQAVRQEMQSSFVVSPEPGTVTFDADLSSGYVYAQIDLLLELDRYVSEDLSVDHDLLRRHLASVVYTMKMFVQSRFGS